MRIYVACLASYNAGILHGRWIDATSDVESMQAEVRAMLRESPCPNVQRQDYVCDDCGITRAVTLGFERAANDPCECPECGDPMKAGEVYASAEEYAIHDSEGLGDIGEYAGLAEVAKRASVAEIAEDRDIPLSVLLAFAQDYAPKDWDADDLEDLVDDQYRGVADSWADFAEEWHTDTGGLENVPDWLLPHIDWDSVGRDFEKSGDFTAYRDGEWGQLYIFYSA